MVTAIRDRLYGKEVHLPQNMQFKADGAGVTWFILNNQQMETACLHCPDLHKSLMLLDFFQKQGETQ